VEDDNEVDEGEIGVRREERRSPATVLGSKRLGIAVMPEELVQGVQGIIDGESYFAFVMSSQAPVPCWTRSLGTQLYRERLVLMLARSFVEANPHVIRSSYLHLTTHFPSNPSQKSALRDHRERRKRAEPEMAMAQAAGFLPGEYAAVRNVVEEMGRRLGGGWWRGEGVDKEGGEEVGKAPVVIEVSGGLGAGLW